MAKLHVPGPWLIAAVFAVHPVHVDSVAWVIGRKDVLSALFYLAAVLAWLNFDETRERRPYILALALFVVGLLSKSVAATLPVVLLIIPRWKRGRLTAADWMRTAPFFAASVAVTLANFLFYRSRESVTSDYTILERALIAPRALWSYLGKLLWPDNLAVIYPHWDASVGNPLGWGFAIATVAAGVLLWRFQQLTGRGPLAGTAFVVITLAPVLGLIDYGYMAFSFVADRYQYLASVGAIAVIVGAAVYGKSRLSERFTLPAVGVAACVIVVFSALAWQHATIYRNEETFYRHILSANPDARHIDSNLSGAILEQERYEEGLAIALEGIERRIAANPANPDIFPGLHANAGVAFANLGRMEQAEEHFRRALEIAPDYESALTNLSILLEQDGRYEEAAALLGDRGVDDPDILAGAGLAQQEQGNYRAAEQSYRQALEIDPGHYAALINLASVLKEGERHDEAVALYQTAMDAYPNAPEAPLGMGLLEFTRGNYNASEEFYRQAFRLDPTQSAALVDLGALKNTQGDYEEALDLLERAAAIAPTMRGFMPRGVSLCSTWAGWTTPSATSNERLP